MALAISSLGLGIHATARAANDAELAQELTNPIADLVTVPIQVNFDSDIDPTDQGSRVFMNIQPVIPVDIDKGWILITRTIVPVVAQDEVLPGAGSQFGLGDINEQLFFSPKKPSASGTTRGVGAAMLLPTATDAWLGSKKWGGWGRRGSCSACTVPGLSAR